LYVALRYVVLCFGGNCPVQWWELMYLVLTLGVACDKVEVLITFVGWFFTAGEQCYCSL